MHREEIEKILETFGFSVGLNKKIEKTSFTHMIHVGKLPMCLVEYTVDEIKGTVKHIWACKDSVLNCIDDITDLKNWLGE